MSDKPLHVQVAEALGCQPQKMRDPFDLWVCPCPPTSSNRWPHGDTDDEGETPEIPHYDTVWSATGPLIEKYRIELMDCFGTWKAIKNTSDHSYLAAGATPPEAVCRLILALKVAGKL